MAASVGAPEKCCYGHWAAMNRAERRLADRSCRCRGECGCRSLIPAPTQEEDA